MKNDDIINQHKLEKIKQKYINDDLSNPHIFSLYIDDIKDEIDRNVDDSQLKSIKELSEEFAYRNTILTNTLIKNLIDETGSAINVLIKIMYPFLFSGIPLLIWVSQTYKLNDIIIWSCLLLPVILVISAIILIERSRRKKSLSFAEDYLSSSKLFQTEIVRVKQGGKFNNKARYYLQYIVYFKDENEKIKKHYISKQQYEKIYEEIRSGKKPKLFVLKYPKYIKGYKYFIFCPTDKFENKSSIKETNKKGSVIND